MRLFLLAHSGENPRVTKGGLRRPAVRGVRKNRYREATRTLQSGVPDNLRGCWSRLYPKASRSKYQKTVVPNPSVTP